MNFKSRLAMSKVTPAKPLEDAPDDTDDYFESEDDDSDCHGEDSPDDGDMEPCKHELDNPSRKRSLDVDDEVSIEIQSSKKKNRKSPGDVNKPPSAQEVVRLRETENLFHSSLFRLQIDEMLSELKVKKKREDQFSVWFSSLQVVLSKMKAKKEHSLMKQKWLDKLGVSNPVLQELPVDGNFQFIPPVSVYLIGSHAVGCCVGSKLKIDVAVEMPKEVFEDRDIVNERFFRKRALYLCCIISHLISSNVVSGKEGLSPKFTLLHAHNPLVPVVEVVPSGPLEGRVTVYLHITASEESFKLSRLNPSKNCVREGWFFTDSNIQEVEKGPATPWHNASILMNLVVKKNEALKMEVLKDSQPLKDAIMLLKVWLKQRELDQGYSTFGNYLMSMLVVYLVRCRRLSTHMSSYQIFRTVLNFLKDQDWTTPNGGITLSEKSNPTSPSLNDFHDHYEVVFVDATGYCNLAAHVDTSSFLRVKKESARALQYLDDSSLNSFQALFMTPVPFVRYFDQILCVHWKDELFETITRLSGKQQIIDGSQHRVHLATKLILEVLKKGLGKRVTEWGLKIINHPNWSVSESPQLFEGPILFGLNLDSEHAYSILEKGPPANMPEAEEFRLFWGSKSELRRFQDGSISEAVVWLSEKDVTFAERRLVCWSIIKYLFKHKLSLSEENISFYADQIESVLKCLHVKPASFSYGTGEEATLAVLSSLSKLSSMLRDLSDLPLDITSIQGISPVCRYADVIPPLSTTHQARKQFDDSKGACMVFKAGVTLARVPPLVSPIEVILHLAQSGKWPDDAAAVKRVRAAFNINIAKCLKNCGLTAQAFPYHVDVLKDGFVFRLRVAYGREAALLRLRTLPNGLVTSVDCKEAQILERETILLPRITGYLHGLHQQLPAFGPTACLVKRWMSAHMFRFSNFPEIVLELLVAYLFLRPEPYLPPVQPQNAFLRFLHMIATTNWHTTPIILNFNNELNKDELSEIERRFSAERAQLPPIFLATPSDHERSSLTRDAPTLTILLRLALLAAESLKILEGICVAQTSLETDMWKQVFRTSLDSYNLLIHLHPYMSTKHAWHLDLDCQNQKPLQLKPYKKTKDEKIPITGFDPIEFYIQELEESYGDFAMFFFDMFGGNTIGVVWKPNAFQSKEFKVSQVNGRKLDYDSKGEVIGLVLNRDAIIEDFYILGKGLVRSIDVLDQ